MQIFFDLDGTLLDSKERLYRLFQHLVPGSGLSFEAYWEFKMNKVGHTHILENEFGYTSGQVTEFQKEWLEKIELAEWLAYDIPFEGITGYLLGLKEAGHCLYLVTARQFESIVHVQLQEKGWQNIFEQVFVTSQKQEKLDLIQNANLDLSTSDWFVGDTGKDIETGKQLGIRTAAVLSGFLKKEVLMEYEPDIIANSVVDIDFKQYV